MLRRRRGRWIRRLLCRRKGRARPPCPCGG
uniref:Uncharacterized protein n=1 Tax=Arundo donax TaxID=35708 RepID=A0A0A9ADC6_ARUDO